jgi:ferric-dicitrate binding protein FerR (iron transport regulator)
MSGRDLPRDRSAPAAAAAELLRARIDGSVPLPQPGERAQGIAALEEALGQRARRRRRGRWIALAAVVGGAAAAAAALVVSRPAPVAAPQATIVPVKTPAPSSTAMTIGVTRGPSAAIAGARGRRAADLGAVVEAGETIVQPPGGSFVATLASGARLDLREGPLELIELGARERLLLHGGAVALVVPKLGPERRLIVDTPDAQVEVRGTRFTVAIATRDPGCGDTATRVTVDQGVVVVRHDGIESRVAAGEHWPICAPSAATPRRPARPAIHALLAPPEPARIAAPLTAPEPSTLAAQNDMFAAAVSARRRGQTGEALRLVDDLLRRFPDGPLAPDAHAERRRLLADPGQAP